MPRISTGGGTSNISISSAWLATAPSTSRLRTDWAQLLIISRISASASDGLLEVIASYSSWHQIDGGPVAAIHVERHGRVIADDSPSPARFPKTNRVAIPHVLIFTALADRKSTRLNSSH